jgi:hypothetical protein
MPQFAVTYKRHLSTANQELEATRTTRVNLKARPEPKDFPMIEGLLERAFLDQHHGSRSTKNLLYISCTVEEVLD